MVQMMQIQGMQYGVENSLKTSLQEVSFKNVVCAGNVEKKHSKPASKISFFLRKGIAKVEFRNLLVLFCP